MLWLTLYFSHCFLIIFNCNRKERLFTFSARFSHLCLKCITRAYYAADKHEKRAEKVNKYIKILCIVPKRPLGVKGLRQESGLGLWLGLSEPQDKVGIVAEGRSEVGTLGASQSSADRFESAMRDVL